MTIKIQRNGPVTTVILNRPEARNAVDRAMAEALADAFRAFDADPEASVGVLYGDGARSAPARTSRPSPPATRIAWSRRAMRRWAHRACCSASR